MDESSWLTERFEDNRTRLQAIAYRMVGSLAEAEDAVQEAWLRLSCADTSDVGNLGAWLTTVVTRVCLDMLRSRKARREESLDARVSSASRDREADPEYEAVLADSVGLALLVVLDRLTPAERIAFVLHDMFDLPFDDIAPIVGRTTTAARQLASRARRRVQGSAKVSHADLRGQREVVDAFLTAVRHGDLDALLEVLDPDVVRRADPFAVPPGASREVRGARTVAGQSLEAWQRARFAQPALVNGNVGIVVAPRGRLILVLGFTFARGNIVEIDVITDPERLRELDLSVLDS